MPSPARVPITLLALAAALSACSSEVERAGCAGDDQCPLESRCTAGVCTAQPPPVAMMRLPPRAEAFALVQLDGTGSADPEGEGLAAHSWTVRATSAPCDPPVVAGTGPVAWVRFGCPGRYSVELVVRDARGLESAPAIQEIDVDPGTSGGAVVTGPDVVTDHVCDGEPLACRPAGRIRLSATSAVAGAALRWSVMPPAGRSLDATRRVSFFPGPDAPAPEVLIESDGSAISGDWIFRVEARDAFGVTGAAESRVSIGNRPPVVVLEAPAAFPHVYDPARGVFAASGEVPYAVHDPDGDPLEVGAVWRHVGDGGSAFSGTLLADRVTFAIEVFRSTPADALLLRGGAGLERTIEIVARDPSGGQTWARVPILVGNRPPVLVKPAASASVPHVFDAARSRYVAVAPLGEWADPDGDPLTASGGATPCDALSLVDGVAQVECAAPYEGTPAAGRIVGWHAVPVTVSDPWEKGPSAVQTVDVLNSPPSIVLRATNPASVPCSRGGWLSLCGPPITAAIDLPAARFEALPEIFDPDGDPVVVTALTPRGGSASPPMAVCTDGTSLPFRFELPHLDDVCPVQLPPAALRGSDGVATVEVSALPALSGC